MGPKHSALGLPSPTLLQGMAALKAAQAGNYTGCMPFLQASGFPSS